MKENELRGQKPCSSREEIKLNVETADNRERKILEEWNEYEYRFCVSHNQSRELFAFSRDTWTRNVLFRHRMISEMCYLATE